MKYSCLVAILFHVAKSSDIPAELGSGTAITQQYKIPLAWDESFMFRTMVDSRQYGEYNVLPIKSTTSYSVSIQGYTKGHVCCCSPLSLTTDIFKSLDARCLGTLYKRGLYKCKELLVQPLFDFWLSPLVPSRTSFAAFAEFFAVPTFPWGVQIPSGKIIIVICQSKKNCASKACVLKKQNCVLGFCSISTFKSLL